jgi:AcrR family transcriptional regulator
MSIIVSDPTPRKPSAARRRLLEAAADVVAERGYHAATLGDIARRAGVTTGAVYSGFGSKKELLLAVVRETTGSLELDFDAVLESQGGLRGALEFLAVDAARTVDAPATRRLVKLQLELLQLALRDETVFEILRAEGRDLDERFARSLESAARKEGVELPLPPRELTKVLFAMLQGLEQVRLIDRTAAPDSLFIKALELIFGWPSRDSAAPD